MQKVRLLVLLDVGVPDDWKGDIHDTLADGAVSAFYEPDMDDSIQEALGRYLSDDNVEATVWEAKVTTRRSLRKGRLA